MVESTPEWVYVSTQCGLGVNIRWGGTLHHGGCTVLPTGMGGIYTSEMRDRGEQQVDVCSEACIGNK